MANVRPPIRPPRLRPGDTIGIVSPSWGGAGLFPHRVARGVEALEALGFEVKLARHALASQGFVSTSAQDRVRDLHDLFRDPAVKLILATAGGDHCCHLLPLLDFDLIAQHPKLLLGFSDITVLNVAIWQQTGVVTLNGPALLTDFAEFPQLLDYTRASFLKTVCDPSPIGTVLPAPAWTEEFLDWAEKKDLERARRLEPSPGWTWLKGQEAAAGVLVGGCLESLQHLRGTRFWPGPSLWDEALLFIETSELAPSPETVDGILMDYENMGVLARLRGLLVGRPMRYSPQEKQQLRQVLLDRTRAYDFPIVTDMDFGHTAPQLTLPLGCRALVDPGRRLFRIDDAAVSDDATGAL